MAENIQEKNSSELYVDDMVKYTFFFVEVPKENENSTLPYYYTLKENQDLWDISYLFGNPVPRS